MKIHCVLAFQRRVRERSFFEKPNSCKNPGKRQPKRAAGSREEEMEEMKVKRWDSLFRTRHRLCQSNRCPYSPLHWDHCISSQCCWILSFFLSPFYLLARHTSLTTNHRPWPRKWPSCLVERSFRVCSFCVSFPVMVGYIFTTYYQCMSTDARVSALSNVKDSGRIGNEPLTPVRGEGGTFRRFRCLSIISICYPFMLQCLKVPLSVSKNHRWKVGSSEVS